jgi:hypothetical protein
VLPRNAPAWLDRLTGHKTRSVFERYNIVSECDVEAAKKLNTLQPVPPADRDGLAATKPAAKSGTIRAQWSPIAVPA